MASILASVSGCVSTNGNGGGPSTKTTEGTTRAPSPASGDTPTRTKPNGVFLGLTNDTDAEKSVTITIRRDGGRVFDETMTLAAGSRVGRPAVITEPGEYRITVEVDSETSRTLTQRFPDENDLPVGSYILEIEIRTGNDVAFTVLHEDPTPTPPAGTDGSQ